MVGDLVDGKKPKSNFDTLATLGKHCSELEKRATEAERELIKLKLLSFMAERVGETIDAVITGVESFAFLSKASTFLPRACCRSKICHLIRTNTIEAAE